MTTRRDFLKGAMAVAGLAILRLPFKLPQIGGVAPKSYADAVMALKPIAYWPLGAADSAFGAWQGYIAHSSMFSYSLSNSELFELASICDQESEAGDN